MLEIDVSQDYNLINNKDKNLKNFFSSIESYELYRNAELLSKENDTKLSIVLLRQAANLEPRNYKILYLLSDQLEVHKKFKEAEVGWKNLVQFYPSFDTHYRYAQCLYLQENDQEAVKHYFACMIYVEDKSIELFEVYKNIGNIFVRTGDYEAAEEYYQKAFSINKNSDSLLVNFGTLEIQRGEYEQALHCLRLAAELNPRNDKAWIGLALVHRNMGDFELSIGNLKRALDVKANNRTAIMLFHSWAESKEDRDQSYDYVVDYIVENPEDVEMSLLSIQNQAQKKNIFLAQMELMRIHMFQPNNQEINHLRQQLGQR